MIKLSLLMPTNRTSLSARARILDVCALAGPDVEVVIRDNSRDPAKEEFLSRIDLPDNCCILFADQSSDPNDWVSAADNARAVGDAARGKFIFYISDDDFFFRAAIPALLEKIDSCEGDPTTVGISGNVICENVRESQIRRALPMNDPNVAVRLWAFTEGLSHHLFHSALRRDAHCDAHGFVRSIPFGLSFRDIIYEILLISKGSFLSIDRLIYSKDEVQYATMGVSGMARRFFKSYQRVGLCPAIVVLHNLFEVYEACKVITSPAITPALSDEDRHVAAMLWWGYSLRMSQKYTVFLNLPQGFPPEMRDARMEKAAADVVAKWGGKRDIDLNELLADLVQFMALSSLDAAVTYWNFWRQF